MMRVRILVCAMCAILLVAASPPPHPVIPPFTAALEARVAPPTAPFIAVYTRDGRTLVFVAARHSFTPGPTFAAVERGFRLAKPHYVIVEGFPTALGENPPPIVAEAKRHGARDVDAFARSEAMHAAAAAIAAGIPFIGGEPTDAEQAAVLTQQGYTRSDVLFAYLVREIGQLFRSKQINDPRDPVLARLFDAAARADAHSLGAPPMTLAEFGRRYRAVFGTDYRTDRARITRADPAKDTAVGRLLRASMVARDRHLFGLITRALTAHGRVLVVYGGSHWVTLSGSLEAVLRRPRFAR